MKPSGSHENLLMSDESLDLFKDGRLRLIQSKGGYRFSIDAILLSEFVTLKKGDIVVELGTGCGIILLLLLLKGVVSKCYGLEIQENLCRQASRNAALNGFEERMEIVMGDLRKSPLKNSMADLVICNPPYRRFNSGRINPDMERAIARHEILVSLEDILKSARNLLNKRGRFAMIYPSERVVDLFSRMRRLNLEPKRIRMVHPSLEAGAKLVLVEAFAGGRPGLSVSPPLIGQGDYSF